MIRSDVDWHGPWPRMLPIGYPRRLLGKLRTGLVVAAAIAATCLFLAASAAGHHLGALALAYAAAQIGVIASVWKTTRSTAASDDAQPRRQ